MRRLLIAVVAVGGLSLAGASAANAGPPVQYAGWNYHHHHQVIVDHCYRPPVGCVRPQVAYYPQYYPQYIPAPPVVAGPGGFVSLNGRNFGVTFGF
jgi:hypothetical protein